TRAAGRRPRTDSRAPVPTDKRPRTEFIAPWCPVTARWRTSTERADVDARSLQTCALRSPQPLARLAAGLAHQGDRADHPRPVDPLAHVVDGQGGRGCAGHGLHLGTRAIDRSDRDTCAYPGQALVE